VVLPSALTLAMLGLYYSGIAPLQAIVAPILPGLHSFSWREFGALEHIQTLMLLAIVILLADAVIRLREPSLKWASALLCAAFVFVFLEEVDYGFHIYELLTGSNQSLSPDNWNRNLHNRSTELGTEYEFFMKSSGDLALLLAFVIAPFMLRNARNATIRLLRPSRWMAATVVVMAVFSVVAHALEDAGLGVIDGVPGPLTRNASEFRELNMYYMFLLYFFELRERVGSARKS
jgi:hypothetical protein